MKISVIIATINRWDEPIALFDSLVNQSFKDFEVVLIDQNENDLLTSHIINYDGILKIRHIKTKSKGASNARNLGIKNAKGRLLMFPDDDCEFYESYLEQVDSYFKENEVDGIVTSTKDKFDEKAISVLLSSTPQKITIKNVLKTVIEAGIIVNSEKLNEIRFDPNMGVGAPNSPYWSDEGPDFILRLIKDGLHFNYCPQFYMFHPNPVKNYTQNTIIRAYQYGLGRGYFLKKHKFGTTAIIYYLLIYVAGMLKGIFSFNKQMFLYFKKGFIGRYEGYFKSRQYLG